VRAAAAEGRLRHIRKIQSGCAKEVWYDRLQIHVYSNGYQSEEAA
jgi:hypothetical protein